MSLAALMSVNRLRHQAVIKVKDPFGKFFYSSLLANYPNIEMGKKNNKEMIKRAPSHINLIVVGTGGLGYSSCLLITTEHSRYMFNCGEGTQRLTNMSKSMKSLGLTRISQLENIFITSNTWQNTGGLLGTALRLEAIKNPEIKNYLAPYRRKNDSIARSLIKSEECCPDLCLYGPRGIEKLTMMAKKFSEGSNMIIGQKSGVFEDEGLKVTPLVLYKQRPEQPVKQTNQGRRSCSPSNSLNTGRRSQSPSNSHSTGRRSPSPSNSHSAGRRSSNPFDSRRPPSLTSSDEVFAYLCEVKPVPAKINVEKCFDVGVTIGPMVGQLQRGQSVTLPDGTVVQPEQVMDIIENENSSFLVIECPTQDHLPSLIKCEALNKYQGDDKQEFLNIVVHMTTADVFNSPQYQEWLTSFGEETNHLIMNEEASPVFLSSVKEHQARLNLVNSTVFPFLPNMPDTPPLDENQKIIKARSGLVYSIRGSQVGFHIETEDFDSTEIQNELMATPNIKKEIEIMKSNQQKSLELGESSQIGGSQYPKVVFLGTGSSEPNKIRCQSCIYVHLKEDVSMVLDCGEDSYGQLLRFYGLDETRRNLVKLKAIFISHMHGDHHLGLLSILKEREKAFNILGIPFEPVLLMAPIQIKRWLKFYHYEAESIYHLFRYYKHQLNDVLNDPDSMNFVTLPGIKDTLGLKEYETAEVLHTRNSFGVAVTLDSGFKLAYSGDTRPCDAFVEIGKDCDLLIHEATHQDELLEHAQITKHSTFSEAIDVGAQMKAKHIILTHFSQRYPHMIPVEGMSMPSNVGIAFDNMQVSLDTLPLLSSFISPFLQIFSEKLVRLELQSVKRTRQAAQLDAL